MSDNYDKEQEQIKNLFTSGILSAEEANSALQKLRSKQFQDMKNDNDIIVDTDIDKQNLNIELENIVKIEAGWYPITEDQVYEGFWNGEQWTGDTRKNIKKDSVDKKSFFTKYGYLLIALILTILIFIFGLSILQENEKDFQNKDLRPTSMPIGTCLYTFFEANASFYNGNMLNTDECGRSSNVRYYKIDSIDYGSGCPKNMGLEHLDGYTYCFSLWRNN